MTDEQWRAMERRISVTAACLVLMAFLVGVCLGLVIGR